MDCRQNRGHIKDGGSYSPVPGSTPLSVPLSASVEDSSGVMCVPDPIPSGAIVITNSPSRGPLSIECMCEMGDLPQSSARYRQHSQESNSQESSFKVRHIRPNIVQHNRKGRLILQFVYSLHIMTDM